MDFSINDDQTMIRDAAENFLADVSDSAAVRKAMASESGYDAAVWQRIASELGWCGIAVAEQHGGLGLGAMELVLVLVQEQIGRRLLCAPFFATVCLAANVLSEIATAAAQDEYLPAIAAGDLRVAVPLPSDAAGWAAAAKSVYATRVGDGWRLQGVAERVVDAAEADLILVFAQADDGLALFALPAQANGIQVLPTTGWDATRRFSRVACDALLPAETRIDDPARFAGYARSLALARLYIAAEQLGAAQACLDLTVAYTATRKQFGRVIAGFQAVKHRCAEMMVRVEALRSAVYGAAFAVTQSDDNTLAMECAMAKALASDTLFFCSAEAIQLHGGVGFTWEYDPQLYFKRAQASSHWLGDADALREWIANQLFSASAGSQRSSVTQVNANADDAFRREIADWMHAHLVGRFASLKHRGGPGDEEADPALRKEWERELAAGRWTCVGWPQEYGGRGLSIDQQVIFHEEYARAGGPGRMGHIGEGLIGPALIRFGSDAQKKRFLPGIFAGTEYWAQGYSEPGAGSDLANVQTRAEPQADGSWKVSGQKIWTSLAHESEWIFVLARCEPGSKGNKGLAFLLMPLAQRGVEIRPIRQLGGGSEFNEVFFDGAVAQADHIVGAPGDGWKVAMGLLEAERGVSTLGQQMHFTHELELVMAAARATGKDTNPQIRQRIAQAWIGLRVMRYNALRMLSGDSTTLRREALIGKYYWSNWHRDLGKLAVDVLGPLADAPSDDPAIRPLQQLFFFSRADTIYAGTNEIQLNLIAERGLGMPREPRAVA